MAVEFGQSILVWLFLQDAFFTIVNFIVYALSLYFAARFLGYGAKLDRAFVAPIIMVVLSAFLSITPFSIGIIGDILSLIIILGVIKYSFELKSWFSALILWLISLGMLLVLAYIFLPILLGFGYAFAF